MSAFDYGGQGRPATWPDENYGVVTGVPYYYAVPGPSQPMDSPQVGNLMAWGLGNGFHGLYNQPQMLMGIPEPRFVEDPFQYQYFGGGRNVVGDFGRQGLVSGIDGVFERTVVESSERGVRDFSAQRLGNGFSFEGDVLEREIGDFVMSRSNFEHDEFDGDVSERGIRNFIPSGSENGYSELGQSSIFNNRIYGDTGDFADCFELGRLPSDNGAEIGHGNYYAGARDREMGEISRSEFHNVYHGGYEGTSVVREAVRLEESFKEQMKGFLVATGELLRELGRGCWDIGQQSLNGVEDTCVGKKVRKHWSLASRRLSFLNEYLPEDRDPMLAWPIVICIFLVVLVALRLNNGHEASTQHMKTLHVSSPNTTFIQLPDGRNMAYCEQGVPAEVARFSIISPHSFLSSRLAGIPGVRKSLLEEFGVRLVSYDLPGFGESDPYPGRDLKSSAMDMVSLANALGITDRFWVFGFSGASMHAWASVRYIPDRVAGVAMFAPLVNPYDSKMNKEERRKAWEMWTTKRKLLYVFARRFPSFLPYFYRRSFLSGKQVQLENVLSYSLGKKDKTLFEDQVFVEYQERDMAESVRPREPKPFVEESVLQVSDWGFSLADLRAQKQQEGRGPFTWFKSLYSPVEGEWTGFLGPIHIWQGMDDYVVPPSMTKFVQRMVPGVTVHMLPDEGHFSYFYFCDDCHKQIFSTIFGSPQGSVVVTLEQDLPFIEGYTEDNQMISPDNSTGLECTLAL